MQLAEIHIDRKEAKDVIARFPRSRDNHINVCHAIAQGHRVINLILSIKQAGLNEDGLPRLAVSVNLMCVYDLYGGRHRFSSWGEDWSRTQIDVRGLPRKFKQRSDWISTCPPVPSEISNMKRPDDLYCWEATWTKKSREFEGIRSFEDPVLLRPVGGNLYSVIAEWDLTELERKIFGKIQL